MKQWEVLLEPPSLNNLKQADRMVQSSNQNRPFPDVIDVPVTFERIAQW